MLVKFRVVFDTPDQIVVDVMDLQGGPAIFAAFFTIFKFPNLSVWHFREKIFAAARAFNEYWNHGST